MGFKVNLDMLIAAACPMMELCLQNGLHSRAGVLKPQGGPGQGGLATRNVNSFLAVMRPVRLSKEVFACCMCPNSGIVQKKNLCLLMLAGTLFTCPAN